MDFIFAMRVLSCQGYDLKEFKGKIDLMEGTYKDNEIIRNAQKELRSRLKTSQFIHCSQQDMTPEFGDRDEVYMHRIDVDERDILAILDSSIWSYILKDHYGRIVIPYSKLKREAISEGKFSDEDIARKKEQYLERLTSLKDPWDSVLKEYNRDELDIEDEVLLKLPFQYSQIRTTEKITEKTRGKICPAGVYKLNEPLNRLRSNKR